MKLNFLQVTRTAGLFAVASFAFKAAPSAAAPGAAMLPFPSGMIKYHMTSSGMGAVTSDVTWTWAKSGELFRQDLQGHLSMGLSGAQVNTTSWTFSDGKSLYTAVPSGVPGQSTNSKVAIKTALPPDYIGHMMKMGNALAASSQSRVIGHGTVLGKPCDIYGVNTNSRFGTSQSKVWVWQKLPLRTEVTTTTKMGRLARVFKMTSVATQVNTTFKPSPSLFRLPAGYTVKSMADFGRRTQQ